MCRLVHVDIGRDFSQRRVGEILDLSLPQPKARPSCQRPSGSRMRGARRDGASIAYRSGYEFACLVQVVPETLYSANRGGTIP